MLRKKKKKKEEKRKNCVVIRTVIYSKFTFGSTFNWDFTLLPCP